MNIPRYAIPPASLLWLRPGPCTLMLTFSCHLIPSFLITGWKHLSQIHMPFMTGGWVCGDQFTMFPHCCYPSCKTSTYDWTRILNNVICPTLEQYWWSLGWVAQSEAAEAERGGDCSCLATNSEPTYIRCGMGMCHMTLGHYLLLQHPSNSVSASGWDTPKWAQIQPQPLSLTYNS